MRLFIFLIVGLAVRCQPIVDPPELAGKPTKPRRDLDSLATTFITEAGKAGHNTAELMPVVSTFIKDHPTFGAAYGMRVVGEYCELKAPASEAFVDDVNKAIQYFSPSGLI